MEIFTNLLKNEDLSVEDLNQLNFAKRISIVKYAYNNIPFYKKFYDSNSFNPESLTNENDWNRIPCLTKNILRESSNDIINPNVPKSRLKSTTTGGSTGEPLQVYFDRTVPLEAFGWRTMSWWGIAPWENQAFVYRNVRKGFRQLINFLMWWPTKRVLLDCSSMSPSDINVFLNKVNDLQPSFIQGYVGGIYDFSKYIKDNGRKLHIPKAIWVTAAPLSESTRKFIEDTLKAPVYDQYGCSEMFWLAAECKNKKGLHVLSDIRHIEFLDSSDEVVKDGEYGDVTITDLENKAFPLIRYKNGDSGRYLVDNVCTCGLPFPLIDKIKGRVSDTIRTPSGISISGAYLTTIFDDYVHLVDGFQIIQHKDYSVSINCILSQGQSANNIGFAKIKNELLKKSNNELEINLKFYNSLIQDGGKLKFVISEL
ncbi:phenylacetate--CoA ligase family protein [Algoriphagus lutimaris]|uniref:phenylacetate--CoA ligase family protein n=1 Tax=Algoriphagus lutimaris TaxID=613197 RepID=UPI00196B5F53|nr:phenylacetate--CoA ligase family protein [Algoriphagus lutimaris]MBN3518827.1 phenylacetate--CoA ligase family protein [Algoriphagus lutimaris]